MNSSTIEGDSQIDNIKIDSIHTIGSEENNVPDNESNIVYEYSIENEVALKQFINIINEKDRGIPPEPFFDVGGMIEQLIGKIFDTVEDASLMFRRNFAEYSTDANALSEWNDINQCHKPRVLVIGSGWASHAFIKCIDNELFRVLVVSPANYFVFTPILATENPVNCQYFKKFLLILIILLINQQVLDTRAGCSTTTTQRKKGGFNC